MAQATASASPSRAWLRQPGKRACDLVLASILLVLLSPLMLAIAVALKCADRGPVLHRRRVAGREGDFDALKFRSMRVDADAWLAARPGLQRAFMENYKLRDDPRVTPLGRWLRASSLDELPQLWNVLRGEMTLVGPRIISPPELAKYGDAAADLRRVRPGLTGYWQVYGRQRVGYAERVAMDLHYINHWSLRLDAKILALTPWAVIRGRGAY